MNRDLSLYVNSYTVLDTWSSIMYVEFEGDAKGVVNDNVIREIK